MTKRKREHTGNEARGATESAGLEGHADGDSHPVNRGKPGDTGIRRKNVETLLGECRFYEVNGCFLPSVTSVLKVINKPELLRWVGKAIGDEILSQPAAYAELLATHPETAVELLRAVPERIRSTAASDGRQFHTLAEMGLWEPLVTGVLGEVEKVALEATVVNMRAGYAGTLDALVVDQRGRSWVVDFKTSLREYPEYALQLAAYIHASHIDVNGQWVEMPKGSNGCIIHPDGTWAILNRPREAFRAFLSALRLFNILVAYDDWWEHGRS